MCMNERPIHHTFPCFLLFRTSWAYKNKLKKNRLFIFTVEVNYITLRFIGILWIQTWLQVLSLQYVGPHRWAHSMCNSPLQMCKCIYFALVAMPLSISALTLVVEIHCPVSAPEGSSHVN